MRIESNVSVQVPGEALYGAGGASAELRDYVFLSPDWVHEVARVVHKARSSDQYFGNLVADLNLNLLYRIQKLPAKLRKHYGGASEALIFAVVEKGVARRIDIGVEAPSEPVHVLVTLDYKVAKQLYLGESSAAASVVSQRVKAKPVNGFRHWPRIAAKSLVTVNRVLRLARKVPTKFHQPREAVAARVC